MQLGVDLGDVDGDATPEWATAKTIKFPGFINTVDCDRANVTKQGSTGAPDYVRWIQRRVGVAADGDFGTETAAAVRAFQAAHGLTADAVVGISTFSALARVVPAATSSVVLDSGTP